MSTSATYYLPAEAIDVAAARRVSPVALSDVRLYHTLNGGEIDFVNGEPVMSDGLEMAVYLSFFGGNAEDSGLPSDVLKQWWGNFSELNTARWMRSETQYLLNTLPPTTGNLRRIELATKNDLAWMQSQSLVRDVQSQASMPARNTISIDVAIEVAPGKVERFNFPRSWGAR